MRRQRCSHINIFKCIYVNLRFGRYKRRSIGYEYFIQNHCLLCFSKMIHCNIIFKYRYIRVTDDRILYLQSAYVALLGTGARRSLWIDLQRMLCDRYVTDVGIISSVVKLVDQCTKASQIFSDDEYSKRLFHSFCEWVTIKNKYPAKNHQNKIVTPCHFYYVMLFSVLFIRCV